MDVLLLDAAPLFVFAAAGIYSGAAMFSLFWGSAFLEPVRVTLQRRQTVVVAIE